MCKCNEIKNNTYCNVLFLPYPAVVWVRHWKRDYRGDYSHVKYFGKFSAFYGNLKYINQQAKYYG